MNRFDLANGTLVPTIADRLIFAGVRQESGRSIFFGFAIVGALSVALLAMLYLTAQYKHAFMNLWMGSSALLGLVLTRISFGPDQRLVGRLLTLVGSACGLFALLHYPLMPVQSGAETLFYIHLLVWAAALLCAMLCWRSPGLATIPAAYIIWSEVTAGAITGLHHASVLDIAPLAEVVLCLAMGMALLGAYRCVTRYVRVDTGVPVERLFSEIILILAVCIHLANYFISFIAKMKLDGPLFSWVTGNNPLNIYLAAADVGHIVFSDYSLSYLVAWFLDETHLASNIFVLATQALAVAGFLLPKRGLILLLAFFDVMHLCILLASGANFWPWILLNLAIIAVISDPSWRQPRLIIGLIAALFVWKSQRFADVAWLGWYDTGANNALVIYAEDDAGKRHLVSTNFFGFYSYPIAHFSYGMPGHATALDTHSPNGGASRFDVIDAASRCDVKALRQDQAHKAPEPAFDDFVRAYHAMAIRLEAPLGWYPWNLYGHHFFEAPWRGAAFAGLDKKRVKAYIYRRESVCLGFVDGAMQRRLVSQAEHRIAINDQ